MKRSLLALAALVLPSIAPAQTPVCITGKVLPVQGATFCQQGETHYFEDNAVYLKSSRVNLTAYENQIVRIVGNEIGVTCRVIDVAQVLPALATLEWCGTASTCCSIKLKLCPGGLGRGVIVAGPAPTFVPLGCASSGFLDGTLLVDNLFPVFVSGLTTCGELTIQVPCDNALVGVVVLFQGARQDIGPVGPLSLSNAVRVQLAPFLPPCGQPNC